MLESVTIYRNEKEVHTAIVGTGSMRSYTLMGDDYITLKFSDVYYKIAPEVMPRYSPDLGGGGTIAPTKVEHKPPIFHIGDYCDIEGERFVVNEHYTPTYNASTGGYDYTLKMVAAYRAWANLLVKNIQKNNDNETYFFSEVKWNYTATLEMHIKMLLSVLAMHGYYDTSIINSDGYGQYIDIDDNYFAKYGDPHKQYKMLAFDGTNIIEALDKLCEKEMYDCEWWAERKEGFYHLHFGRMQNTDGEPRVLETGVDFNTLSVQQSTNAFANRIYVFGGTQNVPYSYRKHVVFTNTDRTVGKLYDKNRELSWDMFEHGARSSDDDIDFTTPAHYLNTGTGTPIDTSIGYYKHGVEWTLAEKSSISRGKYQLNLENRRLSFSISSTTSGMYNKPTSFNAVLRIKGKADGVECDIIPEISNIPTLTYNGDDRKGYSGAKADSLIFSNIEFELTKSYTDVKVTLEVYAIVPQAWQGEKTFSCFCETPGNMKRTDFYKAGNIPVHIIGEEGSMLARFEQSTYLGTRELILSNNPNKVIEAGKQYTLSTLVYTKVTQDMYTSDAGEDVINGVSGLCLRLPQGDEDCPNGYVENVSNGESIVEAVVIHDDIFPQEMDMVVQKVVPKPVTAGMDFSDGSRSERKYNAYVIHDTYIKDGNGNNVPFKEQYILSNVTLQVKFLSGNLAGMTFDVVFDESAQTYLVKPNNDYGALLPNATLNPKKDDMMLLIGWDVNSIADLGMIDLAEQRLKEAALDDLDKAVNGSKTYQITMFGTLSQGADALRERDGNDLYDIEEQQLLSEGLNDEQLLSIGEQVILKDYATFEDEDGNPMSRPLRVIGYDIALDMPWDSPKYTIGEIVKPSRLTILENKLK